MPKRPSRTPSQEGGKMALTPRSDRRRGGYSANGKICFLDLPTEVRVMIYAECRPTYAINIASPAALGRGRQQSLLQAHPVIRREFVDVYYEKNIFWLDVRRVDGAKLKAKWAAWFAQLNEEDAKMLRRFKFYDEDFTILIKLAPEAPRVVTEVQMRKNVSVQQADEYYGTTPQGLCAKLTAMQATLGRLGRALESACMRKSDVDRVVGAALQLFAWFGEGRKTS